MSVENMDPVHDQHCKAEVSTPMRLLNTATLQLQEFPEGSAPPYAILSHLIEDEADECCFQDFGDSSNGCDAFKSKKGYDKIVGFCRQSQKDGHQWGWVDTVCIDRTNYDDLNTAINSMFHWYSNSKVCYAYLEDIEPLEPRDSEATSGSKSSTRDILRRHAQASKWFGRGETLQVLIAPSTVIFFSKDWAFLCNRMEDTEYISHLASMSLRENTTMSPSVPKSSRLAHRWFMFSARDRLRMICNRSMHTRYPEDKLYCLLGLFQVRMDIRYGEGAESAFLRLQTEILRQAGDPSLLLTPRGGKLISAFRLRPFLANELVPREFEQDVPYHCWTGGAFGSEKSSVTVTSSGSVILSRPIIETIDDRFIMVAMGTWNDSSWISSGEAEPLLPLFRYKGASYQRMSFSVLVADLSKVALMYNTLPSAEICIENPSEDSGTFGHVRDLGNYERPDTVLPHSICGVVPIFPLGKNPFSLVAAWPETGVTHCPGIFYLHMGTPLHHGILLFRCDEPGVDRKIGLFFATEDHRREGRQITCRIVFVSKDTESDLERLSDGLVHEVQKDMKSDSEVRRRLAWRSSDHQGGVFVEFDAFSKPASRSADIQYIAAKVVFRTPEA